jgi:hypothetical protein
MKKYYLGLLMLGALGCGMGLISVWGESDTESKELTPAEILAQTAETYYDPAVHGLKRAAAYVTCPEIVDLFDNTVKNIIRNTKFEAIIEPGEGIKVKTRDIPAQYGPEARKTIHLYQEGLERQLTTVYQTLNLVQKLLLFKEDQPGLEINAEPDKKLTKLTITTKKPITKKRPFGRNPKKPAPANEEPVAEITILWITKDYMIDKAEITNGQGKSVITVKHQRYKKCWALKELAIAKYDKDDCFEERIVSQITYAYPQNIMLPSIITSQLLDKKWGLIERRNEANPVSFNFADYEVELKETKK